MTAVAFLGLVAAFFTTAAFVPQAYKTIRTRSTDGLSRNTFSLLFVGTVLWLIYGLMIQNTPIILANTITATLAGIILYLIITIRPTR